METVRIPNGATEKIIALFVDESGDPITGETVPLSIWRESNGQWFTGVVWQAGYTTLNMSEKAQGYYYYDFDTVGLADDTYHIKAICANVDCVNPVVEGELKVGYFVDDIIDIKSKTDNLPEAQKG